MDLYLEHFNNDKEMIYQIIRNLSMELDYRKKISDFKNNHVISALAMLLCSYLNNEASEKIYLEVSEFLEKSYLH